MATSRSRPLAATEECPICFAQVPSMELLSCSHKMCSECLDRILSSSSTSFCPCCRKDIETDGRRRIYVGKIECFLCLKSKDSDEFIWCSVCYKLICCRCQLLEHSKTHAGHQIFEWNTKEAIDSCLSIFESEIIDEILVEQQITGLLKPVIGLVKQRVIEESKIRNDVVKKLWESFKAIPKSHTTQKEPENLQKLAESLAKLSGLETPIDMQTKFLPIGLLKMDHIADVIFQELKYCQRNDKVSPVVKNQSTETKVDMAKLEENAEAPSADVLSNTVEEKLRKYSAFAVRSSKLNPCVTVTSDVKNSNEGTTLISCFGNSSSKVIFGSQKSIGIISENQCLIMADWTVASSSQVLLTTGVAETVIEDVAIVDSNIKAYFLLSNENVWKLVHYSHNDGHQYSLNLSSKLPKDSVPFSGRICCTTTGVPYVSISCRGTNEPKSFFFQFTHSRLCTKQYTNTNIFHQEKNQEVTSMIALRHSQYNYRILARTTDQVLLFTYSCSGCVQFAKSYPICGVSLLLNAWDNDFKFIAVYGNDNMLETYSIKDNYPQLLEQFELKKAESYLALKYWNHFAKNSLSICKYENDAFMILWHEF